MKKFLIILFTCSFSVSLAQIPEHDWQWIDGGGGADCIKQTKDSGYIISGSEHHVISTPDFPRGYWSDYNATITHFDHSRFGWGREYGGTSDDFAHSITQTLDGGFIFTGSTSSTDGGIDTNYGESDCWVVKLDSNGVMEWQKSYGGPHYDNGTGIIQAQDGGYIISGTLGIMKLNSSGNIEWIDTSTGATTSIVKTSDGGFIATGNGVFKFNNTGGIQWQNTTLSRTNSIRQTNDGGYIVAGGPGVIKLTSTGTVEWQKSYLGIKKGVIQSLDGGYIIAGTNDTAWYTDGMIVKLDNKGTLQWELREGGDLDDWFNSVDNTFDGGFIVAGGTGSSFPDVPNAPNGTNILLYLIKFKAESILPVTLSSFTAQASKKVSFLRWQTSTEVNCKSFEVQRSFDLRSFSSLDVVPGHGTTSLQQSYQYTDFHPNLKGVNYYRLKQLDKDGHYTFSNTVAVAFNNGLARLYPNPAGNQVMLESGKLSGKVWVSIYSSTGIPLYVGNFDASLSPIRIGISSLPQGAYILTATDSQGRQINLSLIKR